jgi:CHAT domain-containing protein
MPETPDASRLWGVERKARELARMLPEPQVLHTAEATYAAVTAALGSHAVAHFACHGSCSSKRLAPGLPRSDRAAGRQKSRRA